jgi:hypothetical protein
MVRQTKSVLVILVNATLLCSESSKSGANSEHEQSKICCARESTSARHPPVISLNPCPLTNFLFAAQHQDSHLHEGCSPQASRNFPQYLRFATDCSSARSASKAHGVYNLDLLRSHIRNLTSRGQYFFWTEGHI